MLRGGANPRIVSVKQRSGGGHSPTEAIGYLILHSSYITLMYNARLECFQAKLIRFIEEVNLIGIYIYIYIYI